MSSYRTRLPVSDGVELLIDFKSEKKELKFTFVNSSFTSINAYLFLTNLNNLVVKRGVAFFYSEIPAGSDVSAVVFEVVSVPFRFDIDWSKDDSVSCGMKEITSEVSLSVGSNEDNTETVLQVFNMSSQDYDLEVWFDDFVGLEPLDGKSSWKVRSSADSSQEICRLHRHFSYPRFPNYKLTTLDGREPDHQVPELEIAVVPEDPFPWKDPDPTPEPDIDEPVILEPVVIPAPVVIPTPVVTPPPAPIVKPLVVPSGIVNKPEEIEITPALIRSRTKMKLKKVPIEIAELSDIEALLGSEMFSDPYFPSNDYSLFGDDGQKNYGFSVAWKRPREFLQGKIQIFEGKIESSDIQQGRLGDCWFLSACSSITNFQGVIESLFLTKHVSKNGVYRMRICKHGEWITVTVDDLIPCSPYGGPLYSSSNGPELWVLLLEKAYSKAHGSYHGIESGKSHDAFIDMSGLPGATIDFEDKEKYTSDPAVLFNKMLDLESQNYCLVVSTRRRPEHESLGLVSRHAYSCLRVVEAYGEKLLHLRNPWGVSVGNIQCEWNGRWSDNSKEWTQAFINKLSPNFDSNDGAFWICLEDFMYHFDQVSFGMMPNDRFSHEHRVKNFFNKCDSTGARPLHYYKITATSSCKVHFGQSQEDIRCYGVEEFRPYIELGFAILTEDFRLLRYRNCKARRDIYIEVDLQPGTYYVVPMSTGCYLQRPANAQPRSFSLMTEEGDLHPFFISTLKDVFRRFDLNVSQELDFDELKKLMECTGRNFSRTDYDQFTDRYSCTEQGVPLQGLYEFFTEAVKNIGESTVRQWIKNMGYDEYFYSTKSRPVVFTAISTAKLTCDPLEASESFIHRVWGILAKANGKQSFSYGEAKIYCIAHRPGYSYVAVNGDPRANMMTHEVTEHQNCQFSLEKTRSCVVVQPNECRLLNSINVVAKSGGCSFSSRSDSDPA
jgi:hypothetical protein